MPVTICKRCVTIGKRCAVVEVVSTVSESMQLRDSVDVLRILMVIIVLNSLASD
jgi:hypothetical protein